jgi:hypothetical protein
MGNIAASAVIAKLKHTAEDPEDLTDQESIDLDVDGIT